MEHFVSVTIMYSDVIMYWYEPKMGISGMASSCLPHIMSICVDHI